MLYLFYSEISPIEFNGAYPLGVGVVLLLKNSEREQNKINFNSGILSLCLYKVGKGSWKFKTLAFMVC